MDIIGTSKIFLETIEFAKKIALSNANILITGESGTGKEVFANYIHTKSFHSKGPFLAINCSAIPEQLLESELFGHSRGSFTGATDKKIGFFEEAEGGTVFLDEIGDLNLTLQAKLLRVVQEKKIKRVGENIYRNINVRIITATHINLIRAVESSLFREDLYFRLSVLPLCIPSLRERKDDIPVLADFFLKKFQLQNRFHSKYFSIEAIEYIKNNHWKGNIRELENSIERAVIISNQDQINLSDFFIQKEKSFEALKSENTFFLDFDQQLPTLDNCIKKYIEYAVNFNGGAKDRTAKEIGIDRKTLYKKLDHSTKNYELNLN